jgi:hypothetical protein
MAIGVAIVYPVIGITFAALPAASNEIRLTWRLAAWLLSAACRLTAL